MIRKIILAGFIAVSTLFCSAATLATPSLNSDSTGSDKNLNERFYRYYSAMMVDSAILMLDKIIDLRHSVGDLEGEASARWNKIALLNNSARYDTLLIVAEEQMEWFKEHDIWNRFYQAWQRKCSANHDMGRMQTALREARAMGDDAQKRNDNTGRAMAYKQMGIVYYDIRQLEQAALAFRNSIRLLRQEGENSGMMSGVYDGLCQTLDRAMKYDEELKTAREWYDHLAAVLAAHSLETVAPPYVSCHLAHAAAYIGMRDYEEAVKSIEEAKRYHFISKSTLSLYYIYEMEVRLALAQGRANDALAYADSIKQMNVTVDDKITELRADALLDAGQPSESARLFRYLYYRKDSVFTRDMRTQLDELSTLFRIDEMQRDQQTVRMRYAIAFGVLIVLALTLFLIFRWRESRKLTEKNLELAEKNAELKKASKLAEESSRMKTEFIKNISHEIRTPLNILNGFTQVFTMSEAHLTEEEKTEMRERVAENSKRITELVNKMLELSDASSHSVIDCQESVLLSEIAAEAAVVTGIANRPGLSYKMEWSADAEGASLQTNRQYAVRALTQLLDNSIKFQELPNNLSEACGNLQNVNKQNMVTLRVTINKMMDCANFEVEDTGIGIPPHEAEHIFEEFVQLNSFYDGTGIGLTVARNIARRLGGDVILDTTYSNGARFVMTLPLKGYSHSMVVEA